MAVSLGSLAGTGIGLLATWGARRQKNDWTAMSLQDKTFTVILVVTLSLVFCAGLVSYSTV